MSTVFDVYPTKTYIPSFDEVLHLSNMYLRNALDKHGIEHKIQLDVRIMKNEGNIDVPILKSGAAKWNDDEYAWFHVAGAGGCDAYFNDIQKMYGHGEYFDVWEELFSFRKKAVSLFDEIKTAEAINYCWGFRRSAGQPGIINLGYGLVAAAFAKLTDGIIDSWDGAWDAEFLPVHADEFLEHYFVPSDQESYNAD